MDKTLRMAVGSLILNIACSAYYIVFGALIGSWWLLVLGFYYCVLSTVRFIVIRTKKHEHLLAKFTGWMLIIMSLSLVGVTLLATIRDRGHKFNMIIMIAIATYAFARITAAIVKLIGARNNTSQKIITLRNISLADAFVSIFSLQRSMLATFEGMSGSDIILMNSLTGSGVCIIVFLLGFNLVKKKKILFISLENQR